MHVSSPVITTGAVLVLPGLFSSPLLKPSVFYYFVLESLLVKAFMAISSVYIAVR